MTKRTNILIKRLSSVVLFLCAALAGFAQVDTAFWFAVPRLAHGHAGRPIKLCVATLDQPATVTVSKPATNTTLTTFTVPANSSQTYQLVGDAESALTGFECSPYNTPLNYGIYIHSTAKMNAYIAVQNNNSEIYALKGNSALGTQFFIPMQYQYENATYGGEARNSVQVIATENNTSVQIIPTQTLYQNGGAANSTINVTLHRGQVYNFASNTQTAAGHICGTVVTSNKPIVVDVSDDSATPNGSNQDLVADQIVPEDLAGYQHVVVPSPSSVNNSTTSGGLSDYAFIVIQAPTGVYFNVDARPSDALAIALRTRIPSYFRKDLFENQMLIAKKASDYQETADFMSFSRGEKPASSEPTAETEWETMSLSELKDLLQNAIDEENYELAAKIQEEIDKRGA